MPDRTAEMPPGTFLWTGIPLSINPPVLIPEIWVSGKNTEREHGKDWIRLS